MVSRYIALPHPNEVLMYYSGNDGPYRNFDLVKQFSN